MLSGIILGTIYNTIVSLFLSFWQWILGGAVAFLAFMFSPMLRKYTIGGLCVLAILFGTYLYGYNSNHNVEIKTHSCQEFRDHLVKGPATDKAIRIFAKNGLCEE